MNNQIIIDMIKTLASHLTGRERADLYDQLDVTPRYDLEEHVEIVDEAACYRVFGSIDADEADIHNEMISYLNNEGYDVINWDDATDVSLAAGMLDRCIDGYYVFMHEEDGSHLAEMARMLQECSVMALPMTEHYLEDPTGSEWERDFREALDHFWSGQGSERQSEKVKFIMNWLADQV